MSKLRLILIVVIFYLSCSYCNFSEIVKIDEIIENSTLLPTFDDQIKTGKTISYGLDMKCVEIPTRMLNRIACIFDLPIKYFTQSIPISCCVL